MFSLVSVADLSAALHGTADALESGRLSDWDVIEWIALPEVAYPYSRFYDAFNKRGEVPYEVMGWYEDKVESVAFEQAGGVTDMSVLRLRVEAADKIEGKILARGRGVTSPSD